MFKAIDVRCYIAFVLTKLYSKISVLLLDFDVERNYNV